MCTRRDFIKLTFGTTAAFATKFRLPWAGAQEGGRAKSVLLLWMAGAPSQLDTFDPKPGTETGGPFKPLDTKARGVRICEHFARLAQRMDKVSLIRTVHSKDPNHDTARYLLHTGYRREQTVDYPHVGSLLTRELGTKAEGLPGCVTIGGTPGAGCGYLKPDLAPFIVEKIDNPLEDIALPPGINRWRLEDREKLLEAQAKRFAEEHRDPAVEHHRKAYERALALMRSEHVSAFDVSKEPEKVRKSYGDSAFGRAVLMARRLVEAGVRFVEVQLGDWDTHADNFNRTKGLIGQLDPAFSALLDDLSARRMLDETLVLCMGEFGRTPRINLAQGRDHFARAWSVAIAGGGIAGGRVVGKTDALGMEIRERPVSVQDLYATVYDRLGVDTQKETVIGNGRPIKILGEGKPVKELFS
jgi:hypothetical protein